MKRDSRYMRRDYMPEEDDPEAVTAAENLVLTKNKMVDDKMLQHLKEAKVKDRNYLKQKIVDDDETSDRFQDLKEKFMECDSGDPGDGKLQHGKYDSELDENDAIVAFRTLDLDQKMAEEDEASDELQAPKEKFVKGNFGSHGDGKLYDGKYDSGLEENDATAAFALLDLNQKIAEDDEETGELQDPKGKSVKGDFGGPGDRKLQHGKYDSKLDENEAIAAFCLLDLNQKMAEDDEAAGELQDEPKEKFMKGGEFGGPGDGKLQHGKYDPKLDENDATIAVFHTLDLDQKIAEDDEASDLLQYPRGKSVEGDFGSAGDGKLQHGKYDSKLDKNEAVAAFCLLDLNQEIAEDDEATSESQDDPKEKSAKGDEFGDTGDGKAKHGMHEVKIEGVVKDHQQKRKSKKKPAGRKASTSNHRSRHS